ncbi:MAG: bifunctional nuclease family protein, partial [Candidatus Binatia bacterium]
FFEARAIAMEMEHVPTPRPMTHDLIRNMLEGLKAKVKKVTITDLTNGTFYAAISFLIQGSDISVDSRPSDAIALAVRVNSPVYVVRKVLDEATTITLTQEKLKDEDKNWRTWLEDLSPTPVEEGDKLEL